MKNNKEQVEKEFKLNEKKFKITDITSWIYSEEDLKEFIKKQILDFTSLANSILECPKHNFTKSQIRAKILNQVLILKKDAGDDLI